MNHNSRTIGILSVSQTVVAALFLVLPSTGYPQIRKNGAEFQANWYVLYDQLHPRVAAINSEECMVVWMGWDPEPGGLYGIRGRVFDRNLLNVGDEFLISVSAQFDKRLEQQPSIAATQNLGFVVAWESEDADASEIAARAYCSQASEWTGTVAVSHTEQLNAHPEAAADKNNFFITWISTSATDEYRPQIRARTFSSAGQPTSDEFGVSFAGGWARSVSVTSDDAGSFIIVWQEDGVGIVGQRFDASGTPLNSAFLISTAGSNPVVAAGANSSFVVAWERYSVDSGYDIFARRFARTVLPIADEFQVNTYSVNEQVLPSIDSNEAGNFVILWESYSATALESEDGSGRGVFGQYFESDARPLGYQFRANAFVPQEQGGRNYRGSDVAVWPNGEFVATWASQDQDGIGWGVFGQMFAVDRSIGPLCGDTNADLIVKARDALYVLRGSVGLSTCDKCLCDVDSSGVVSATDALLVLRVSVGSDDILSCCSCS